jgi:hypothetical protein
MGKQLLAVSSVPMSELMAQDIPAEDPRTYKMLCKADSVGVFQVESRAHVRSPRLSAVAPSARASVHAGCLPAEYCTRLSDRRAAFSKESSR